jgi:hypothetical protein
MYIVSREVYCCIAAVLPSIYCCSQYETCSQNFTSPNTFLHRRFVIAE